METIEQLLESNNIRVTAMRMLIYKFLAEKEVAVTLSDIENAFEKSGETRLFATIRLVTEFVSWQRWVPAPPSTPAAQGMMLRPFCVVTPAALLGGS